MTWEDATMLLRYTLAGAARPWLGGEADDAHAARGQDDEDKDVDGIHVGLGVRSLPGLLPGCGGTRGCTRDRDSRKARD